MEKITGPSKGLGDSIAKVTHALGIDIVAEKVAHMLTILIPNLFSIF